VLDYVRARKGNSKDAGRNDRQQRMLFAIFEHSRARISF
jgi:anionic cell wall polymer biosynthesis LytR-Cps2A-Psr (LCP) family protein